jgi:hypothetical protein
VIQKGLISNITSASDEFIESSDLLYYFVSCHAQFVIADVQFYQCWGVGWIFLPKCINVFNPVLYKCALETSAQSTQDSLV